MSVIPSWVTPAGTLGSIPEGVFYQTPLLAVADEDVYYRVIAGRLPPGIQINETGVLSGSPQVSATVQGVPSDVTIDTTSKFAIRAYTTSGLADRTFTLTITGQSQVNWVTPAGEIATYYDGTQIEDLTVDYYDPDIYAINVVELIAGQLPPGLAISSKGVISGYIAPNTTTNPTPGFSKDGQGFSQYGFDFSQTSSDATYQFTLRVTNGTTSDVRTYSISVYARSTLTADNTQITADNTFITADASPLQPPIITTPEGSIGSVRSDNFYAFQFTGIDFNLNAFQFIGEDLPPGLTLDPNSGWLYGYIPYEGISSTTYTFSIIAQEVDNPSVISQTYYYSLTINGPVNSDIIWLTNSDLGTIDNGATSTLYVKAVNVSGLELQYRLASTVYPVVFDDNFNYPTPVYNSLPQGLELLPSGHIAGRVSFDTFALDGGTTTFDVGLNTVKAPTTFDLVHTFTVNAYSINGLVNVNKTFSIRVVRRYNEPYDNLYIQAMPPNDDRALLNSLLQNTNIFPPELIYRNDDSNFGVAKNVVYQHAYGLTAATIDDYVASLNLNHYWKNLTLGQIKTARALDDAGNVIYEVVYSEVVDDLVNNNGVSVGKDVVLPYPVEVDPNTVSVVYPNSLFDMRNQVIDTVGQISNVLPRWMLSRQENGQTLGFTNAWVIAYTNPGQSGQIAYNIQQYFGDRLNLVDFEVDRYELDNLLTKNWDRETQNWVPQPPSLTTFDVDPGPETVFDQNSLQFIAPVDMYSSTQIYDKYLVFPKRNILQ